MASSSKHTRRPCSSPCLGHSHPHGTNTRIEARRYLDMLHWNTCFVLHRLHHSYGSYHHPCSHTHHSSAQHLPGFIANIDAIRAKGVEAVYCLSVNDRFVMRAWAENTPGTYPDHGTFHAHFYPDHGTFHTHFYPDHGTYFYPDQGTFLNRYFSP